MLKTQVFSDPDTKNIRCLYEKLFLITSNYSVLSNVLCKVIRTNYHWLIQLSLSYLLNYQVRSITLKIGFLICNSVVLKKII